ncbi:conserved hypothetical protein [Pirellula staleyi DSM 6068]|uniref:Probable inorganic carbon transporter subunit DabA n=1 Tax=Pirellula staleyi (strain ATCC 27377 / DSM 6068 / ICPB 4128) TaxID=530564 RepID=D2R9J3_PIRSD|nr:DUF2309 domain-containing protein [Pirellula staleyi]ADB17743.1 conserved hypothetical protein [Pirellula staleyi DSM 6068]
MSSTATADKHVADAGSLPPELEELRRQIIAIGDLLPPQGPISAFVFLNALQALEDLPFEEGLKEGARLFRCQPYLPEERYRERITQGRIRTIDLQQVLIDDLNGRASETIFGTTTRYELRLAMLRYPLRSGTAEELRWYMDETDSLKKMRSETPANVRERFLRESKHWIMRDGRQAIPHENYAPDSSDQRTQQLLADLLSKYGSHTMERLSSEAWESIALQALWRVCESGVQGLRPPAPIEGPPLRHRDILVAATGEDSDILVHEVLIRFCAAFADQGFAEWSLPDRDAGFFRSFCHVYGQGGGPPDRWLAGLAAELQRIQSRKLSPLESIHESLQLLGVSSQNQKDYLTADILALQGWAGLLWNMEVRGDRVAIPSPAGTLIEFVAIRLILERLALAHLAKEKLRYHGSLPDLYAAKLSEALKQSSVSIEERAFYPFQLAQVLGWNTQELCSLSQQQWQKLLDEIESFHSFERRRILHLAFERQYRIQALDAVVTHSAQPVRRVDKPRFQVVCCIDAREESFRRHLEEVAPDVETFGAPGFFGVAIYYRGLSDANFAALCPIVVRPKHWVIEEPVIPFQQTSARSAKTRRALGVASLGMHRGSRNLASGALLTASLGVLASIPLVARVLFPRWTAHFTKTANSFVAPPTITRLRLERQTEQPGIDDDSIGFSVAEMANMGEKMLRDIGLTENFARLVVFMGHGSFCLNNPHKSAYDCGACSGGAGGPNARALATFLNDPRVREIIASRGLTIPKETWFLGGLHNTALDSVTFSNLDLLPASHRRDLESMTKTLEEACGRNAHERCRRFYSAPLDMTPSQARTHAEERSEDLAQTRPEFGNASNAMCFVGRRSRVRNLYMDRRCFMHSYDPNSDDASSSILGRILAPVVPVCQGINLMYYFSAVDPVGWGSGTKLPHNVTSLLGVMDGYASDLRTGLPVQGVEIHEPMRLLFVIETTPERILAIMDRDPVVGRILKNGWAQLAILDPHSSDVQLFHNGRFEPYIPEKTDLPHATSSVDWYRGWREHLGFASVQSSPAQ